MIYLNCIGCENSFKLWDYNSKYNWNFSLSNNTNTTVQRHCGITWIAKKQQFMIRFASFIF